MTARGEKRIQLEYQQVLTKDSGIVKYVYPLNTEKFPSKPVQTFSELTGIKPKAELKNIYSPSHKIDISRNSDGEAKVSFEESNSRPDKDFVLYYTVADDEVGISLLTHKQNKEDGYFMLLASPKVETDKKIIIDNDDEDDEEEEEESADRENENKVQLLKKQKDLQ